MASKELGFRIIAKIYPNRLAFTQKPEAPWGYRFFDETGKQKRTVFDMSVKDMLSNSKKDMFNAISMHCKHAHFTKSGNMLNVSFEDGVADYLPVVSKEGNTVIAFGQPMLYKLSKKDNVIQDYYLVSPVGTVKKCNAEELKQFILVELQGAASIQAHGVMNLYNLSLHARNTGGKVSYVITRAKPNYSFPEV